MKQLVLSALSEIPMIKPGDELGAIIMKTLRTENIELQDGDIIVIAQKIISKSEGRLRKLSEVEPSKIALEIAKKVDKDARFVQLVLKESSCVLRTRPGTLIVQHKLGFICANAGIDHSNVLGDDGDPDEWVLLLPENPDASALKLRTFFEKESHAHIGVLIIDSHGRAWRMGIVGISIGFSGLPGVVDMRGKDDLFNYKLRITQIAAADELAAAASLLMGQANEGTPVVHVRGFPYALRDSSFQELIRSEKDDLFR